MQTSSKISSHKSLLFRTGTNRVATTSTVPWYVIAMIHNMECGLDFSEHLHNGDPLARRTINDPPKRFEAITSRLHPNYRAQS